MLGRKVADAFSRACWNPETQDSAYRREHLTFAPFTKHAALVDALDHPTEDLEIVLKYKTLVSLPHPSGRNLIWNDPAQCHRARALLAEASPWFAEGGGGRTDPGIPGSAPINPA